MLIFAVFLKWIAYEQLGQTCRHVRGQNVLLP